MAVAGLHAGECPTVTRAEAPLVSLVLTVRNEAHSVDPLLASIAAQTHPPDEVVVVDGGSSDGTVERLERWRDRLPLVVLARPGSNIARGRNEAIRHATGDLLAVTDAGVRLDPCWLEELLGAVREDEADIASGFFAADARGTFEIALGATTLPGIDDVDPATFLPSSRSVLFTRAAWHSVGGYPEWLDYCEDLVFDLALRARGCRFVFVPTAIALFRPRATLPEFFRQYYLYARGDGKADLWRGRHAIRYATYLCVAALLLAGRGGVPAGVLLACGAAGYTRRPYQRLIPGLRDLAPAERLRALALVPLIRFTGDVAKMLGYPAGVAWRLAVGRRP